MGGGAGVVEGSALGGAVVVVVDGREAVTTKGRTVEEDSNTRAY